jgi:hypothetical protein
MIPVEKIAVAEKTRICYKPVNQWAEAVARRNP